MTRWTLLLAGVALCLAPGCRKNPEAEAEGAPKCLRGELRMSAKMCADMGVKGEVVKMDCPTRLSTDGPAPPDEAWIGDASAFWGPELIVQLDKEWTASNREAGGSDCLYKWAQGCSIE